MRPVLSFIALLVLAASALGQPKLPNLPPDLMAPTDALTPADERKQFTVPDGFDVQLVAAEPDIQKPIQMAFDARGRLWVTTSYHYPFAAQGKATDKLFVLSDFDPATGKAKKVQTFADDLNIPIGILPLPDCKSCIVSSVGEIRKYTDTTGAGKADKMEVLYSGFGSRDTHGMYNSFTLMPDGWVYACHGFSNDSTVRGKDGHEVKMNSGNTFRFRPDGSRIEVWTRGQVNPFGIAVDPWFNLYTADCHSKPITQLIPGAYYDSFGKPHDGLGFAPHVTHHDHGSTALCGLTWYDADQFPKEYKGTMFLGNVVTNRVNFDAITWKGATPVAKEQPDFLVSKDRWFRPVDIKLGPDGALYVADFYNKIIGHYEVDLKDPRRDKDRGRVWRIVWRGKDGKAPAAEAPRADFTAAKDDELLDDLLHPNLTVRLLAGNQLRSRSAAGTRLESDGLLSRLTKNRDRAESVWAWAAFILAAGKEPPQKNFYWAAVEYAKDPQNGIKPEHLTGHLVRALAGRSQWGDDERKLLLDVFKSLDSPHLTRAAVEAVIAHPHADLVAPVIAALKKCAPDDTHLRMAAKIALRNCLRDDPKAWPPYKDDKVLKKDFDPSYAEIALAIPNGLAADYLLSQLDEKRIAEPRLVATAEHIARYGDWYAAIADITRAKTGSPALLGDALLGAFRGVQARGARLDEFAAQRVLAFTANQLKQADPTGPLDEVSLQRLSCAARVLIALPAVTKEWGKVPVPEPIASRLEGWVEQPNVPADLRAASADALLRVAPEQGLTTLRKLIGDTKLPPAFQERLLVVLASSGNREARLDARDALKTVPYRIAVPVATSLAGTRDGADLLLIAVKDGKAPARLLQEKAIRERLRGSDAPDWQKRVTDLTKSLAPADQRIADLIKTRATGFATAKADKVEGAKLFTKHCAACHRIGDTGGKIAPQLDGIGVRGAERLFEDVLDPNRNVDQAFRARSITLTSERTLTALMLRVEGEVLVVADLEGREQRIPLKDIAVNRETMLSAMPANFADVVPEADMYHIVAYLLDQKAKDPPKK
ncbi:PVC-type heme-binding CxxCH protein [Frigoriglobus tundricola]|uniref:Beta-propeller-type glycoside hydrolase n=1 Tax=Frigoriglobus tundricola TaxID=2774151 RepID=A0A6M5YMH8_9BACT|nr:PVC-type heme-binding CxxCH protein [Frigoriglobus tundricola]QJW95329.1 beta-propeller-type glycoside hydrolase [Frigoriglobus tundricola]